MVQIVPRLGIYRQVAYYSWRSLIPDYILSEQRSEELPLPVIHPIWMLFSFLLFRHGSGHPYVPKMIVSLSHGVKLFRWYIMRHHGRFIFPSFSNSFLAINPSIWHSIELFKVRIKEIINSNFVHWHISGLVKVIIWSHRILWIAFGHLK